MRTTSHVSPDLADRLSRLPFLMGPVDIKPIAGGISNRNFVVRAGGRGYFVRMFEDRSHLGTDRRNEMACQQAAVALGLAPEILHHEPGLLVSRLIEGRTLTASDLRAPSGPARAASLLRRLHGPWDAMTGEVLYFCPFQAIRTYARTAAQLGAERPADLTDWLEDARRLSRRIAPFRPVFCHNDLLPANLIDDGHRLWLVDWEYGGMGHPFFDLANLAANAAFEDHQEESLLTAYLGAVSPHDFAELRIFRVASLLREALWATIQTITSDIEFDYRRYAADHYRSYQEQRAALDSRP